MNANTPTASRIRSIDIVRGAVMVLMAIDHVRVFAGVPAGGPDPAIFFTRWITHFCAPAFIFLAGTSAFLYGTRHDGLSKFLLTRGLWLVLLELTFLRVAWTFNFDFAHYEMAGVIWVIGWCMVLMAALVKLPPVAVGIAGLVVVAGHNLLDGYARALVPALGDGAVSALWKIAYIGFFAGPVSFGADGPNLIVLYSIVPWIGVMAAGYGFGKILLLEPRARDRACVMTGAGAVLLFLILRGFNIYGDPRPWISAAAGPDATRGLPSVLSFLNTTKYPASLSFLLMTLGPTILLLPAVERARGIVADALSLFGRVPFFFYILHIPLIHALAMAVSAISVGGVSGWLFTNHPMDSPPPPEGYTWGLGTLYLVWAIAVSLLYLVCRWFAGVKARRGEWWLRYL